MADRPKVQFGGVQETLLIPIGARARETLKKRPLLEDPKAAEILSSIEFDNSKYGRGWGGIVTVLRTAIFDAWVRAFLAEHPSGTVVELGTGLNSRYERVDNGKAHWIDLDLPEVVELRRKFFDDSERRQIVAASVLDEDWFSIVEARPKPYFFVAEGVLVYLPPAPQVLARISERFPDTLIAFDTYTRRMLEQQHRLAEKRSLDARWAWACDDPRSLVDLGLEVVEMASVTRPPSALRSRLPRKYVYLLPLARKLAGDVATIPLFKTPCPARASG